MRAARREETLRSSYGGRLITATVLRVFLKNPKGADARRQERRNTPQLLRWPLDHRDRLARVS